MPKTREDLVNEAVANLGVALNDQPVPPEDYATVNDIVIPVFAQLALENNVDVVAYVEGDDIPDAVFLPMSWILAAAAGNKMGLSKDTKIEAEKLVAIQSLITITAATPTYETLAVDYF